MQSASQSSHTSLRVGQVITVLVAVFLLFDGVIHVLNISAVVETHVG